ncbi:hypothetical protein GGD87_003128 [Rhodobaca bogoriensis DSM 18756]|nr:hypothetical protein [Rhodobaca bogoriensis DSM 18756]
MVLHAEAHLGVAFDLLLPTVRKARVWRQPRPSSPSLSPNREDPFLSDPDDYV